MASSDLPDNPMGTDGFEFVEYTAPDPQLLRSLFERLGFPAVARHRSKNVTLHRQGGINFIINAEPQSFAQAFARGHGPSACAMAFRVRDAAHAYSRALDEFTEALSNKGDMVEAWDNVGFVHLRLGAYQESIDDYNHALALKPDLMDAIEHRAEAYLAVDRIDDVRAPYMDLYNHDPVLAAQLMTAMQKWMNDHQTDAKGMRPADIAAFGKWLSERDGIAKQAASLPQH